MQQQGHGFKPRKFSLPLVILGLFTAGAATGCDIARRQQAWRLANLLNAQGSSSFTEHVKPSAEVICNEPLIVPWSREPCVTYGQTITNLFEMRKKSIGNAGMKPHRSWSTTAILKYAQEPVAFPSHQLALKWN